MIRVLKILKTLNCILTLSLKILITFYNIIFFLKKIIQLLF